MVDITLDGYIIHYTRADPIRDNSLVSVNGKHVYITEGCMTYWKNGKLHCETGPAVVYGRRNGKPYKIDVSLSCILDAELKYEGSYMKNLILPIRVTKMWYQNGMLHREPEEGKCLPSIVGIYGKLESTEYRGPAQDHAYGVPSMIYYNNGQISRTDGPAIETPVITVWAVNGMLDRNTSDGPAVIRSDSCFSDEYWVGGMPAPLPERALR